MLDFAQLLPQLHSFSNAEQAALPQLRAALAEAGQRLRESASEWQAVRARIAESHTSWLLADLYEPPDTIYSPPERPTPCDILATDGSQIVPDRHDLALCCLLNIGRIALRYGPQSACHTETRPLLFAPDETLLDDSQADTPVIAPRRLAMRRQVAELTALVETDVPFSPTFPLPSALALLDGSLILWPLESESEAFRQATLTDFIQSLETARTNGLPIAAYISRPRSRDVVNALRLWVCPHRPANCDTHCPNRAKPRPLFQPGDCAGTEAVTDADLFATVLKPGQRSTVFGSRSKILNEYPAEQRVRFFYLHVGGEIARVEIPAWVADDPDLLAQTHTLCYDQASKGDGYPLALAEAHELAVVRQSERDAFFQFLERRYIELGLEVGGTRKAQAKRTRRI